MDNWALLVHTDNKMEGLNILAVFGEIYYQMGLNEAVKLVLQKFEYPLIHSTQNLFQREIFERHLELQGAVH